ncbi:MAG: hypothetical protein A2W85_02475, partial [Bacteroidetes bacterium GWF2_41_31]
MKKRLFTILAGMLILAFVNPVWSQVWEPMGPEGGNIISIDSTSSYLFSAVYNKGGGNGGGIFKSADNGQSWENITGNLENKAVRNMWIDGDTILVSIIATNNGGVYSDNGGIFRSTDNGETWTRILTTMNNTRIAYLKTNNVMFMGGYGGVSRSYDQGQTWQVKNGGQSPLNSYVHSLESMNDTIFIGVITGIFRSTDDCQTWTIADAGIPSAGYNDWIIDLDKIGSTLYAASYIGGVFKSSDHGSSWVSVNNGLTDLNMQSLYSIGSTLFAGTYFDGIFKSTDGGDNWYPVNQGLPNEYVNCFFQHSNHLFSGGVDGVYKSDDNAGSWTESNQGIAGHVIGTFTKRSEVIMAAAHEYLFAGTFMGRVYRSADNGLNWEPVNDEIRVGGIGTTNSLVVKDSMILVGTENSGVLYKSADLGENWETISFPGGLAPSSMLTVGERIYTPSGPLYFTDDEGISWDIFPTPNSAVVHMVKKGDDLFIVEVTSGGSIYKKVYMLDTVTSGFIYMGETIENIHSFGALGDTLYAGVTNEGIYKSGDNGVTWVFDGLDGLTMNGFYASGDILFARDNFTVFGKNNINGEWTDINYDLPTEPNGYASALFANDGKLFTSVSSRSLYASDLAFFTFVAPDQPDAISGPIAPCIGSSQTYSVTNVPYVTYTWQFPADWTVLGGAGTNEVTVEVGTQSGVIIVTPSNIFGTGPAQALSVTPVPIVPAGVSIMADNNPSCPGFNVNFTATPINGGNPFYQWYVNGDSVGTDQATYSYIPDNDDQVYVVMTSDLSCTTDNPATSDSITMVIGDLNPVSVTITADQNNVCESTIVNFLAIPVAGGNAPVYQWYVNGTFTGNGETYSYSPSDGDVVFVIMTSSLECTTGNPAVSNTLQMQVSPYIDVTATIAITQNNLCEGSEFNFTSATTGGGNDPQYQWMVNGVQAGENMPEFTYVAENGDEINLVFTSGETCTTQNPVTSNAITAVVNPLPEVSWPGFEPDTLCIEDWGPVTLSGATPAGGTYSG